MDIWAQTAQCVKDMLFPPGCTSATITQVQDTSPPSVPTNVRTTVGPDLITGKDIIVTWTASTDNVGVTGYNIYRNGSARPLAAVNGTALSYTDANLPAGTYRYTVEAFDSAGNRSVQSAPSDPATGIIANDPPVPGHSLIAFPARDFISATGYPS